MSGFKIGDIVARKSYGGDVYFRVINVINNGNDEPTYQLKGLLYRLHADSRGDDLVKYKPSYVQRSTRQEILNVKRHALKERSPYRRSIFGRIKTIPGKVLHLDADGHFLNICLQHYADANVRSVGKMLDESEQPRYVRRLLQQYRPDLLVVTGHDGLKKSSGFMYSLDNYVNSKYFIQSVYEARSYEPDPNKLCIFAGACQSYFEAIMKAGANFASSPERVLINALDPALVQEKIALTDSGVLVTPEQIAAVTVTGSKGIGGIITKGHLTRL